MNPHLPVGLLAPFEGRELLIALADAVSAAGRLLIERRADPGPVRVKPDGSPVSDADERAQDLLVAHMLHIAPGIPIVAEECFNPSAFRADRIHFLIDPIDGTKEFLSGRSDFTVNVAMVERGTPVLGCVYAPARGRIYVAGAGAQSARLKPGDRVSASELVAISTRSIPANGPRALVSRAHLDAKTRDFLRRLSAPRRQSLGSSLKFCLIAEGRADLYPRLAPTMEWDTAAGHAVLVAAGGAVLTPSGAPLRYGKPSRRHNGFIAWGRRPERSTPLGSARRSSTGKLGSVSMQRKGAC
jgi:3'(2'), 5'-bisphosphate nucleotidase